MELAKAYVQVIPSADGIQGRLSSVLGGEASSAGDSAGKLAGGSLVTKLISVVAAAKIGQTIANGISAAISEGAELEQSIGGIETLFKESSDVVIKNAQNAFKTAGMSADEYMKSVTGFSASLLQGLGGDTAAAANVADMALTDMSDNANKMGTDMELIQNAYQGFAKQNYTMLDNLKLGYGGTKSEMERLLADAQKLTGVKYDMNNLADVYSAIHAVQGEMGISGRTADEVAEIAKNTGRTVKEQLGTTAKEGATTFSGSLAAVKASLSNLAGYMAIGEDIGPAINNLVETASTFFFGNLIPMIGNIVSALPAAIGTVIETAVPFIQEQGAALISNMLDVITNNLPGLLEKGKEIVSNISSGILANIPTLITNAGNIVTNLVNFIGTNLPMMLKAGADILGNILNGIINNLPGIAAAVANVFENIVTAIGNHLPNILSAGAEILLNLINGIVKNFPKIVTTIGTMIIDMVAAIGKNLPKILQSGIEIIGELTAGIIRAVPELIGAIPGIIEDLKAKFKETDWGEIGKNIIDGLIAGIKSAGASIGGAVREVANSALEAAKKALGINSPSRKFKWIGEMCIEGFDEPLAEYNPYNSLQNSMKANINTLQASFKGSYAGGNAAGNMNVDYRKLGNEFTKAFEQSGFKLVIEKRELGRVVREVMA